MNIKKLFQNISKSFILGFSAIIGYLGAYSGSHGTSLLWRRCGIPVIITISAYIYGGLNQEIGWILSLFHISCMSLWGSYSLGYGIPDITYPLWGDEGSDIGRFWTMLFRKKMLIYESHKLADYFTRTTVALSKVTAIISIPIMNHNWISYIIGAIGIILTNACISWRGLGSFKKNVFGKEVDFLWSDTINYTIEGICYYIIIFVKI